MIDGENMIEMESTFDGDIPKRGCATVVNNEMLYFGGSSNPNHVCYYSNI